MGNRSPVKKKGRLPGTIPQLQDVKQKERIFIPEPILVPQLGLAPNM